MALRIATFNAENMMQRFDFSGWRNELRRDRTLQLVEVKDKKNYEALESARVVAHTDDKMQLTALAVADTCADIICLQEVENLHALSAFEYGYLFKMVGAGYRRKYLIEGNDGRGIDVAVMTRDETADGDAIEFVAMQSHAHRTYEDFGIFNKELREIGEKPNEKVFRRDCLEIDFKVGGKPVTLFVTHLKSMTTNGNHVPEGMTGRDVTMAIRTAEARAIRRIVEDKFGQDSEGKSRAGRMRWLICGDMNDYRERLVVEGTHQAGYRFSHVSEEQAGFDPLVSDGFSINLVERREVKDRWTLYHSRGPQEQHLCQLDYIFASPAFAEANPKAVPDIVRNGQPWRTPFPPGQEVERYPRIGWDRPKSSDHCPVAVTLNLV
ncbi:MAG: endonuclease/exonuclease/phosphatase family protein [Salaquimonas sp.]|jgi:endonuclease/exonuclease/phosphatase family metal-dependent hydrolase|nr:endonuclease/exonuclease/phosphatase family protein [Salaquimonas sp.]